MSRRGLAGEFEGLLWADWTGIAALASVSPRAPGKASPHPAVSSRFHARGVAGRWRWVSKSRY